MSKVESRLEKSELMLVPARRRAVGWLLPAMPQAKRTADRLPAKAAKAVGKAVSIAIPAPSAAPEDEPMMNGSARALRKTA
jgi:hypothetical protein